MYLWLNGALAKKIRTRASEPDFLFIRRPEFDINLFSTNQIRVVKKPHQMIRKKHLLETEIFG